MNDPVAIIHVSTEPVATATVEVSGIAIDAGLADILNTFLELTVVAGVRLFLRTSPAVTDVFEFPYVLFLTGTVAAGVSSITATYVDGDVPDPTVLFPAGSSLVLDATTAVIEELVVTTTVSRVGNQLTFDLAAPLAFSHPSGSTVTLFDGSDGFGDSTEAGHPVLTDYTDVGTIGGRLSDVR